jgi:hypothetical protein
VEIRNKKGEDDNEEDDIRNFWQGWNHFLGTEGKKITAKYVAKFVKDIIKYNVLDDFATLFRGRGKTRKRMITFLLPIIMQMTGKIL